MGGGCAGRPAWIRLLCFVSLIPIVIHVLKLFDISVKY